jgi:hypothetical protein
MFLGDFTFAGQFVGPLDQRRSSKGEKLLISTTDWRKHCSAIPQWPAPSYEQWKRDNAAPRPPPRRDAVDIAQLRVELVAISSCRFVTRASTGYRPASTHVSCSDKPVALGSNDSIAKAKELQEWSAQIDRMDELVHTREELRAYSPAPSRFNDIPYSCRSYSPPPPPPSRQRPCPRSASSSGTSSLRRSCRVSLCGRGAARAIVCKSQTWSTITS